MQGGGEALNPIFGTTPSSDQPSQGGIHCGCLQHRHCPGGATCSGIAGRRRQWFMSDCRRSRAPTALNPPGSCEEPVHSLCFEERSLYPSLDFRQPLDIIFPCSLKELSSLGSEINRKYNVRSKVSSTNSQKIQLLHDRLTSSLENFS